MLIIAITNKTKEDKDLCDYKYEVFENYTKIATGGIKGHKRSDGWKKLIDKLALSTDKAKKVRVKEDKIFELIDRIMKEDKKKLAIIKKV